MPVSPQWSIHFRKQFTAPPLPTDLLQDYSLDSRWIRGVFNSSVSFLTVFDRDPGPVASMGWWLEYLPVSDSTFESAIEQYSIKEITDYSDGWNYRYILDSFSEWWKGARCKCRDRGNYLADVALSMLTRTSMLLDELCEIEAWIKSHAKDIGRERSAALAHRHRYWRYLELTLIRSEVWWRYHNSIPQLYHQYMEKKMDWQACWFENPLHEVIHERISNRLRLGHVDIQETECDPSRRSSPQTGDQMDEDSDNDEDDEDPNG
jgi:hypothetical protein